MYDTAGPVAPEQAEHALRFAKLNAAQLPGWMSPLVKRKNWWSCLLISRTCESRARSASTIFSIIHHYGTFNYHCFRAHCVLTVPILSGNLQYYSYQQLCPMLQWQLNSLCKTSLSCGSKILYWLSLCSQHPRGQHQACPARWGKEDLHLTWEISPAQYSISPVAKSWEEWSCVTDVYTELKRSIPLLGGDLECAYLPLFTTELRLQLVSEEDKFSFLEKNEGNCHVKKGPSSVTTLLIPREDARSLENRRAGIYSCEVGGPGRKRGYHRERECRCTLEPVCFQRKSKGIEMQHNHTATEEKNLELPFKISLT